MTGRGTLLLADDTAVVVVATVPLDPVVDAEEAVGVVVGVLVGVEVGAAVDDCGADVAGAVDDAAGAAAEEDDEETLGAAAEEEEDDTGGVGTPNPYTAASPLTSVADSG
jgi:hypothetical protein